MMRSGDSEAMTSRLGVLRVPTDAQSLPMMSVWAGTTESRFSSSAMPTGATLDGGERVDEAVFEHDDALRIVRHFGGAEVVGDLDGAGDGDGERKRRGNECCGDEPW